MLSSTTCQNPSLEMRSSSTKCGELAKYVYIAVAILANARLSEPTMDILSKNCLNVLAC